MLDLGEWWQEETGLPLPLGVNVGAARPRRRLDDVSAVLGEAIRVGLENRDEALAYAERFGRGIDRETADRFVAMYVNELTTGDGDRGRRGDRGALPACLRAVILSAVRTPVGRRDGALAHVRPDDLAAAAIEAAVGRAGIPAAEIEDVWFGCANQAGEDNRDVARMAALLAGLPESVAGVTVNRLCASGLAAVVGACHAVLAGDGDLFVAGGVESMSRAPFADRAPEYGDGAEWDTQLGWRFPNPKLEAMFPLESMGETAENVAERWSVSREDQDAFALRSQQRWAAAAAAGRFDGELVAVARRDARRASASRKLAREARDAEDVFREGGTVTAGNASGINDGAAALVVASEERAHELGADPLGSFVGSAVAGVDPRVMGIGPVPAVREAARAHRRPARGGRPGGAERGVCLTVAGRRARARPGRGQGQRQRWCDRDRTPARHERRSPRRLAVARAAAPGGRYGIATLCVGVGQGQAALFERVS